MKKKRKKGMGMVSKKVYRVLKQMPLCSPEELAEKAGIEVRSARYALNELVETWGVAKKIPNFSDLRRNYYCVIQEKQKAWQHSIGSGTGK